MPRHVRTCALAAIALVASAVNLNAQNLPPGTTACDIAGMSMDPDRKGAAVRAEPDMKAKIVGRLAPPQRVTKQDIEDTFYPEEGFWRTEFRIVGIREGWVLIDQAMHPYNDPTRDSSFLRRSTGGVKTYTGPGWFPLKQVGGKLTFWRKLEEGALWVEPKFDARRVPAKSSDDRPIRSGGSPKKILTCEGEWVKVESHDGVVGWWPGLCGKPYADCER